ncbi:hypothetical protein V1294_006432 [Bradyrhizobium sp. AZCC 1678]|uniref:hypothetical protein n=1 Tax=Bradyrhizobium sp. AZCC 1678 TaxID=3117030 RepID=UPI002FF3DE72
MQTPVHSGPALRGMILRTPAVWLMMLPSSRIVWASKPPSMNTLLTPGVVPKCNLRRICGSIIKLVLLPTAHRGSLRLIS